MEKKLYYTIDNGDTPYTMTLEGCMELINGEMSSMNEQTTIQDKPEWTITPVWMTEAEYDALPEN